MLGKMDRWVGKVAIVTGASSGIGAAVTQQLVLAGMKVVGLARRQTNLQQVAAACKSETGKFYPIQCDVSKEEEILKAFHWVDKELGGVDVLVNNAGVLVPETIADGSTENYHKIMNVNVIATAICAKEMLKSVRKRNAAGHIINVNSIAGHNAEIVKMPLSLYCASKYAVTGMSQSLRNEIITMKLNVKVTSISPGAVKTDMIADIGVPENVLNKIPCLRKEDIADAIMYALATPPNVQVNELTITAIDTSTH